MAAKKPIEEHIGDSRTCKDRLQILYERAREGLTANEYVRSQLARDPELALAYLGNTTRGRELLAAALSGAVVAIGNRHPRASQVAARSAVDTADTVPGPAAGVGARLCDIAQP